jgi:hypothetical protein
LHMRLGYRAPHQVAFQTQCRPLFHPWKYADCCPARVPMCVCVCVCVNCVCVSVCVCV